MLDFVLKSVGGGIRKIKDNPQLFFTIGIAVLIIYSFVFVSERFIGIANDAQERLINVRIGSLQDAFVSFARDNVDDPEYLNQKIREIVASNETIKSFEVIVATGTELAIIASDKKNNIGKPDPQTEFLYSIAAVDPSSSVTTEIADQEGRFFVTARSITDRQGNTVGAVITTQTLSMADLVIEQNIRNSIALLVVILALIMVLFLRHSRIIDYTALYKKLKGVDQMKDDFISLASHELRAPLTIIRGYTESIREAPELTAGTKDFAVKIDDSAKNLDSLVADILDVSRIEQGRMSFKFERFNPKEVLEDVMTSFKASAEEKGLKLKFDQAPETEGKLIDADKQRLRQVVINLISNAIKYTVAGEVKIRQYLEKDKFYIRVSDTGIGMSAEEREKLFGKFYRIRTKETKGVRGTGLGLWISAQIVKEMNGSLSVESIKGTGSHFVISFPMVK